MWYKKTELLSSFGSFYIGERQSCLALSSIEPADTPLAISLFTKAPEVTGR